jgi:AcrR family transcriptional regulator
MVTLRHTVPYGQSMPTLTADAWTRAAAASLATDGVDAVRVERLASQLGVSKGSFYWHFADRQALLASVLAEWEARGTDAVIGAVEADAPEPRARVASLLARVFADHGADGIEVNLRAWARRDPDVAAVVDRVDARRVGYLADGLAAAGVGRDEAERRSRLAYRALLGEFLLRGSGRPPMPAADIDSLAALLTS